jgi:photosystem II stability/assembly factor-like uncharacterized protein
MMHASFASVLLAALLAAPQASAAEHSYPRFQPTSIAFFDAQHGVLAEDDWACVKAHGCQGRILVSSDGGAHWRMTYQGARGIHLYPVRETRLVWAITGTDMIKSRDGGLHWQHVLTHPAAVSFVTPIDGWRIGATTTLQHPPPLEQTSDGGRTWIRHTNPCRRDFGLTVAVSFATRTRGWLVCATQAAAGYQGKAVWRTDDGGGNWRLESRTHPIGPPEPNHQVGNLPGFGYATGVSFLADGHGWLWEDRGWLLTTRDGGSHWRKSPITQADQVAAKSASLLDDVTGYVLLRGCTVRLVRTRDGGKSWDVLKRWGSPTTC